MRFQACALWLQSLVCGCLTTIMMAATVAQAGPLDDLARPHDRRSRRETSTARLPDGDYDPLSCFERRLAFSRETSAFCL